jgi:hypothetical protein
VNNTEKKLDALIDALGFDVEEKHVFDNEAYTSANRRFNARKENYIHPEFKFTKRDEPVEENKTITVSHALNMLCKHDRDIIDSFNNNQSDGERDYKYIKQIKDLVKESGIPKSVIIDLIEGIMPDDIKGNNGIDPLDVLYNGVALRQLVENINNLSELDKNYRWIKYPLDSYCAVYGHFSKKMIIWSCKNYFEVLGVKVTLDELVDDEHSVNIAATEAFKNVPYTARTTISPSTILKRELLAILERAGKKPKKDTIAIIEHAIDKAFKNE